MKKMSFWFWIAAICFSFGNSAEAADWTGVWVTSRGGEIAISQSGQQINAVGIKLGSTSSQYGWKIGDQVFYGTLNGQTMTGKIHGHFPISYQASCPAQWDWYEDMVLTISSDGNTIQGEFINSTIYDNCAVTKDTAPTAISYSRKNQCFHIDEDLTINITCAEYQGVNYKFNLNYSSDLFWKADVNTFAAGDIGNCISVGNDLKLNLSCTEYKGGIYSFRMNFVPKADDPFGVYWQLDIDTFTQ